MRLGHYLRVFSALSFLLLWHSTASAESYYWESTGVNFKGIRFPSAQAGCQYAYDNHTSNANFLHPMDYRIYNYGKSAGCSTNYASNSSFSIGSFARRGTECELGSVLNPVTGGCDSEDPCADKAGIEEGFSKAGTAPDGFAFVSSNGMFGTQRQGCKGGCATEITDVRLKGKVSGAYYARGTARYTGQQCATTGTGDQIAEDTNESTDPQTVKEEKPCVYTSVGGVQVCESSKSEDKEGQSCGTVNGVPTCVSKEPSRNGIDIRTEATTETHADGSTTTTRTDTATATTCKGVKRCTTNTATTTTTTTKNPNGSTTNVSSSCVGNACPDRNTDPDGDGDGFGDCATGTKQCGSGLPGSGGGEGQDWYTPGDDTFASVLTQFAAAVKQTPIATQTTNFLTFNASGSCPQWSISVWVFDIDIDQLCSGKIPWDAIRAVVLAAAAFLAFRIALF